MNDCECIEEKAETQQDVLIREYFLSHLDAVTPAWPNVNVKGKVMKGVQFLSLEKWRAEVGEQMFDLAIATIC
jgi:hypothetical protein